MEFKRLKERQELINSIGKDKIKVITGLRRCGKSYLLNTIFKKYLLDNGFDEANIVEIDLLRKDFNVRSKDQLFNIIEERITRDTKFVFIDEVQLAGDGFADILKIELYNHQDIDFYVTGSNSKTLSSMVVRELGMDAKEIKVNPLTYSEVVQDYDGFTVQDYLEYGGIPYILIRDEKERVSELFSLFNKTYISDILDRCKTNLITDRDVKEIIKKVLKDTTSEISDVNIADKITKKSNCKQTEKIYVRSEVADVIKKAKESYLFIEFNDGEENESDINKPYKGYCIDIGLYNVDNKGNFPGQLENAVFLELYLNGIMAHGGSVQRKDGSIGKIDFEFTINSVTTQIQVCYILNDGNWDREIMNLVDGGSSINKILVYYKDESTKPSHDVKKVSIYDFLKKGIMKYI